MNNILSNIPGRSTKLWLCSSCLTMSIALGGCKHFGGVIDDCADSLNKAACGVLVVGTAAALVAPFLGIAADLMDGEDRDKTPKCGYDDSPGIPWVPGSILDAQINATLQEPHYRDTVLRDPSTTFAHLTDEVVKSASYEFDRSDRTYGQVSVRLPHTLKYENGVIKAVPTPTIEAPSRPLEGKMIKTVPDAIQSKLQGEALEAVFSKQLIKRLGAATLVADVGQVLLENRKANELAVTYTNEPEQYRETLRQDAINALYRRLAQQINFYGWSKKDSYLRDVYRRGKVIQRHNDSVLSKRGCFDHPKIKQN